MIGVLRFLPRNLFWVFKLWGFHYVSHCKRGTLLSMGWNYVYIWKGGGGQVGIDLVKKFVCLWIENYNQRIDCLFNFKDWLGLSMFECVYLMACYVHLKVHLCPFESLKKRRRRESLRLKGSFVFEGLLIWVKSQKAYCKWLFHAKNKKNKKHYLVEFNSRNQDVLKNLSGY